MEAIFLYFGKMIAVSAVMSAYYLLFLRDKTFHHYNRFYLLSTVVLSLFLPLLKLEYFTIETDSRILLLLNQFQQNTAENPTKSFDFWSVGIAVLALISLFLILKIAIGLLRISRLRKEFPKETLEGITFYNTNLQDAPFSFFRNLFWKNSILINSDLGKQILKHEMVHIEQKHSIDKLFIQIVQSVFWFNPIFYFIKKEINLIHEYLADHKAVKQSDTRAFAQMLLASNFSGNVLPATSPFLSSNLKKRLKMLTQQKTKFSYARRILALPILFLVSFALLVNAKNKEIKETNNAIAIAVQTLKKDTTIRKQVPVDSLVKFHQEKIKDASEKLKKENEKITTLSEETRKKSEELQKIAKEKGNDSYEFELKAKELDQLGREIDKVAQSDDYVKNVKILEWNGKELEDVFNSKEFKEKFKFDEKKLKELEKLGKLRILTDDVIGKVESFSFPEGDFNMVMPQMPRNGMTFRADVNYEENKANLTKAEKKKLEKLSKERKELAEKQAELAKKQAEIAKQQAEISRKYAQNNPWIIGVGAHSPNTTVVTSTLTKINPIKVDGKDYGKNVKIYIDGKLADKAEMEKLNPSDIATVNVYKNNNNGKEEGEIKIVTKK
ncbi:hypothetical protein GCM10010992_01060 [Cloacibacterium rupense]|uniref:Peptidase M56 domain-containing protein n=1 Tax=Cloacibacterium rupense TaxID=517423 RepID=A0ABQ2NGS8_9FLAO|nr:M56 family metallopeptidase [Cloacibacterium rupense]GGP01252.1 hypothetical protein GCM10010992_01060 [Cloacibacterium rupense]